MILFPNVLFAQEAVGDVSARIEGDSYLGEIGNQAEILLGEIMCTIYVGGLQSNKELAPEKFKITLNCGKKTQVLWDIEYPAPDDYSFDDPKFLIEWAGDRDGDGAIDLIMDMSAKYSCWKKVTYLSTKATENEIVGDSGEVDTGCGC